MMLSGLLAFVPTLSVWDSLERRNRIVMIALSAVLGIAAIAGLRGFDVGEMNLGGFDHVLPQVAVQAIRVGFLALAGAFFWVLWRAAIADKNEFCRFFFWALVPSLLISSCARPAQRYLLFALPWMFYFLIVLSLPRNTRSIRYLGWASVILFAGLSAFGSAYGVAQGRAADRMGRWIVKSGLAGETERGELRHHCEQYFPLSQPEVANYAVSVAPGENVVHTEAFNLFGHPLRAFYLNQLKPTVPPVAARQHAGEVR
jgi:hypothetical protein